MVFVRIVARTIGLDIQIATKNLVRKFDLISPSPHEFKPPVSVPTADRCVVDQKVEARYLSSSR